MATSEPPPAGAQHPVSLWALPTCQSHLACPLPLPRWTAVTQGWFQLPEKQAPWFPGAKQTEGRPGCHI